MQKHYECVEILMDKWRTGCKQVGEAIQKHSCDEDWAGQSKVNIFHIAVYLSYFAYFEFYVYLAYSAYSAYLELYLHILHILHIVHILHILHILHMFKRFDCPMS